MSRYFCTPDHEKYFRGQRIVSYDFGRLLDGDLYFFQVWGESEEIAGRDMTDGELFMCLLEVSTCCSEVTMISGGFEEDLEWLINRLRVGAPI